MAPAIRIGDLLAADPLLPHRDEHLDTAWVCGRLEAADTQGRRFEPIRLVRSKYRIGESLRAVHQVAIDGRPSTVTGRTFPGGSAKAARVSPDAIHDQAHQTVWWIFPDDRRMHDMRDVVAADPYLAERLGIPQWASSAVAEYAPERSLTVRADDTNGRVVAYVKRYAPATVDVARFARRYDRARAALAPLAGVTVPQVMSLTDDTIAMTAMPGSTWRDLRGPRASAMLGRLGEAIARFHTIDPTGLGEPFGRMQVRRVLNSADLVATARPELRGPLDEIAGRLAGGPPPGDASVLLHGDCHPGNSLGDGDRLALIDFDQAGVGSPACDIASLVARVRYGALLGQTTWDEAAQLEQAFLTGYARHGELPAEESLRWHVAATYVAERAIRAVNRVHVDALTSLDRLVALALDEARRVEPVTATPAATPPSTPTPTPPSPEDDPR